MTDLLDYLWCRYYLSGLPARIVHFNTWCLRQRHRAGLARTYWQHTCWYYRTLILLRLGIRPGVVPQHAGWPLALLALWPVLWWLIGGRP